MQSELDMSEFWCWYKGCPDYGKKGVENIVFKERYGNNDTALYFAAKPADIVSARIEGRHSST